MTSAYEINRKNRPKVKGYSLEELGVTKENFVDFYKKWKNNELQFIDTELVGNQIQEEWERLSSSESNIHEKRLKKLLIGIGDTYSDMRTIDKEELKESWKDPIDFTNQVGSFLGVRGLEAAGWLTDKTLGAAGRWTGKNIRGLDEGNQQLMGIAAQFAAPSVIKQIPKIPKIPAVKQGVYTAGVRTGLQYKGAKQLAKNLKKVYDENLSTTPSKRVVTVKAESIIDDVVTKSPKDIRAIVKVAKQNKISLSKAEDWINLSRRGIKPKQRLNPGTNNKDTKLRVSPDPLDKTNLSYYASIDDIRNAEIQLQAKGIVAPTTDDIYNYLSEYVTDFTKQPPKQWYNKNFKKTTIHDLHLYGKSPKDFKTYPTFADAQQAAEVDMLTHKLGTKKRWQGMDAKIFHSDEYVKFFGTKDEGIKVLPYNRWHQVKKNPFVVPKDVINKLKKMESRQLDLIDDKSPTIEKITRKGKVIDTPAKIKCDAGTVDEFVKYVNDEIAWQTEQQRLDEGFAKALYKDLGIRYNRGKSIFSRDKSHAVARSEGGPGYTFLEAWWSNQQRGAKEILKPEILAELGIPRTWEEYFYRWYQQQGQAKPITDLGRLEDISWDDYERAMNGVPVNEIKIDRRTINHLIQRQIADPTTVNQPGTIGKTIGEDFDILVKRSKGLPPDDELLGEINLKEFDLVWIANTYQMGAHAKGKFLKEKYEKKFYQRAYRQNVKEQKQTQKKTTRDIRQLEKKGQGRLFKFLDDLFPDD